MAKLTSKEVEDRRSLKDYVQRQRVLKDLRYNLAHHDRIIAQFLPTEENDEERFKKAKDIIPHEGSDL